MSALQCTSMEPTATTRARMGCRATTASWLSESRNGCHCEWWICFSVPLAECRSLYSGARSGRKCLAVLVAHMRSPSLDSNFLRRIFLLLRNSSSCAHNLASFSAVRCTVSQSKLKVHPHHVMWAPSCALRQEIGTPSAASSASTRATSSLTRALWSRIRRSSTYSHKRCGVEQSKQCSKRLRRAPRRCHQ